ncbi:cell division protein FtsQ/DivIB [Rhizobacter sp. LjRoot28]|jgi:cell division protein FtsQ|uniref:cell division protein FtsQ/DivIB n=1 Tax=Rhizobacter sp. LjRoot28 TaxID=3342309 RepID=UPI003ED06D30
MVRRANFANPAAQDDARERPFDVRLLNITASVLFGAAALIGAVGVVTWLVRQPVFDVRAIRVEGDVTRNSVSTIRTNALPHLIGNYFSLDLAEGQRAFQNVPWVRQAVVRRVWPNRLSVALEEHRAAALWSMEEGSDRLVNTFGEVFQANIGDVEDEGLPTLQGPEGTAPLVLSAYHRLSPVFQRLELRIQTLAMSGRGSWRAGFDNGAEVELGRGTEDELVARTERFVGTVGQVIARYQRPLVFADLRHNQGYALRLKGITTTTQAAAAGAPAARN